MAKKPNSASVTKKPCGCGYLQQAADEPGNPIRFDESAGEFQFIYREPDQDADSMLILYHCPFCGGAAPPSKRRLLFEVIPREEEQRLNTLLEPIRTIEDAISLLGVPDSDGHSTSRKPETDGAPPATSFQRELTYRGLSDVADVWISEGRDGHAYWQLHGKPKRREA
ncbi:hypothetical protein Pla123a_16660 [Posidoniimonas polymericola]|uniref:Uncharacterized protein n=1 Tax=Posidoniimonas polymericola TaxID=2528002 RepID=A0A5C5YSH5_9BACT|nr:hypothetical protein [Posidoniimonas polymericola]TWT77868.1 hypothetical protein Pla123a_16660 [Posidoniimonas polymericola]